jgi:hypothetical protein
MNKIKKIILLALAAVVLAVLSYQGYLTVRYRLYSGHKDVLSGPAASEPGAEFLPLSGVTANVQGMLPAADNGTLRLYVEEGTGNIALYDSRSGDVTYAVPPNVEKGLDSGINRSRLKSQLFLECFTPEQATRFVYGYDDAILYGQVELRSIEYGVRVIYTLGRTLPETGIVPVYITKERLEAVLAPLLERGEAGERDYLGTELSYEPSKNAPGHYELLSTQRGSARLEDLNVLFEGLGYTLNDFYSDWDASGMERDVRPHVVVPVDFKLQDDGLVVSVDTANIVEEGWRIGKIELMRGFGVGNRYDECTGCEKCDSLSDAECYVMVRENGYIVVPNGSGSLIYFNNGSEDEYMQYIYGKDPLVDDYAVLGITEKARLPYFGILREGDGGSKSILARVESGDALAYISAGTEGRSLGESGWFTSPYNYAFSGFVLRESIKLSMSGSTGNEDKEITIVERDLPNVRLAVRYTPLTEDYGGYSGMARKAREQLTAEGLLSQTVSAEDIPFYMDIIGSVKGQKFFAGISYMGQIPMTRYNEAAVIVDAMAQEGVTRQVVNYQGWFNRGYYHDVADKIKPVGALGRVKELEELASELEASDGKLYSDTSLQSVPWSSRRYRYTLESSRFYGGGMVAGFGLVNPITLYNTFSMGYLEVMYNILSPRFLTRYTERYIKAFDRYDLSGTSLRDMGDILASDRKRTDFINREESKEIVLHNLELLAANNKHLMASGGNMYALAHLDDLIGVPLSHNATGIVDAEIPFYAMVIHGSVEYAGEPINLSSPSDEREVVLRLLEHGAAPRFTFTHQRATDMKYTGLNFMYSTYYGNWVEKAADIYHTVNAVLGPLSGVAIERHEILENGLRCVTYENGTQIIINYSDRNLTFGGENVPAMGFLVKEGAA